MTSPDLTRFTGWQAFILTDAPYASALAIAVWAIHRAGVRRGRWYLSGAILVVFAASLRPQGLVAPAGGVSSIGSSPT